MLPTGQRYALTAVTKCSVFKLVHKKSASGFITQLLDKSVGSDVLFKNVLRDAADFVFFGKTSRENICQPDKAEGEVAAQKKLMREL